MKKISTIISFVSVFFLSLVNANAGSLTVYTAIEAEDLKRYAATFNEDHPDIEINCIHTNSCNPSINSCP